MYLVLLWYSNQNFPITGDRSKNDPILLVVIAKYIGFCVYRGSYFRCPLVILFPGTNLVSSSSPKWGCNPEVEDYSHVLATLVRTAFPYLGQAAWYYLDGSSPDRGTTPGGTVRLPPPRDQRLICSSCAGCKSLNNRGKPPCTCESSICRKRTNLSTESCFGGYSKRFGIPTKMLTNIRKFHDGIYGLAFVWMTSSSRNGLMSRRGRGKAACCRSYRSNVLFAAALHAVLIRFSEHEVMVRNLV